MIEQAGLLRRTVLGWLSTSTALSVTAGVAACQQAPRVYDMQVSREPAVLAVTSGRN